MTFGLIFDGRFGTYLVADTLETSTQINVEEGETHPAALTTGLPLPMSGQSSVSYTESALKMCNFGAAAFAFAGDGSAAFKTIAFLNERVVLKPEREGRPLTLADFPPIFEEAFRMGADHPLEAIGLFSKGDGSYNRCEWDVSGGKLKMILGREDIAIGTGSNSARRMVEFARSVTPPGSNPVGECAFFCDRFLMAQVASEHHHTITDGIGGVATAIIGNGDELVWAPERTTYIFFTNSDLSGPADLLLIYKTVFINGACVSLSYIPATDDLDLMVRQNPASSFDPIRDIPKLSWNSPVVSTCFFRGEFVSTKIWQRTFIAPSERLWQDSISVNYDDLGRLRASMFYESHPDIERILAGSTNYRFLP
ncbi:MULTISPECIES: hypothetical protein [Rhizobium]|uniref:hypothetical protein n=1 Tax=Rhizobium TaxID=379 RepID=UPI0010323086|nr:MULTISPECIES: hypothetical protein [Rhizobium]TBD43457.1 hypothetical protein ELH19_15115 [Rhizobium ruizarguesonis]TBY60622.1 hypothetical protein E0H39_23635 [Rhizobium leguminosarum bv. viciae]